MLKTTTAATLALLVLTGCRTGDGKTTLKADEAVAAAPAVVGLDILDNKPAVTQIPADVNPATDWDFSSGNEYWLYSSRGKYMTFSSDDFYAPYQNGAACNGETANPNSACSVKASNVAKACQYTASLTLKALMETELPEYAALKQDFGGDFSLFGWMNDGHSDAAFAIATWQGPFIWRGSLTAIQVAGACPTDFKELSGYIKWVSSIDKAGKCLSPSKGQLLALIAKARKCLKQNNPAPSVAP